MTSARPEQRGRGVREPRGLLPARALPAQAPDVPSCADIKRFAGLRAESTYGGHGREPPARRQNRDSSRHPGPDRQQRHVVDGGTPITQGR